MCVLLYKCLIALCCRKLLECLVESHVQEFELCVVHALIVDLLESVELCLEGLVCFVPLPAGSRKIDELRVKSECRVRVVWV